MHRRSGPVRRSRGPISLQGSFQRSSFPCREILHQVRTFCSARDSSLPEGEGFGIKSRSMILYIGSVEDSHELIQFFRHEVGKLKALRKIVISREKTVISDVNKDTMEFPGLTY